MGQMKGMKYGKLMIITQYMMMDDDGVLNRLLDKPKR